MELSSHDPTKYWECKDGRIVKISEMSDSHLLNTLKMLERIHSSKVLQGLDHFPLFRGEMAQLAAEQELVGDIQLAYRLINAVVSWSENSLAQPEPEGATDPELTPLEEHNRRKQLPLMGTRPSMPNGIACPNCGKELMDSNPDYALLTHPIQYRVHCPHCDWSGTRF